MTLFQTIFKINAVLWVLIGFWLFNSFLSIGAFVERRYLPVRIDQSIQNIWYDKSQRYFCWDYFNTKVRDKTAITTIVRLKDKTSQAGYLFTPFKGSSMKPWNLSSDINPGRLIQPFCIYIPPGFVPSIPFTIEQEFVYPGFMGLWNITTIVPPISYDERGNEYER